MAHTVETGAPVEHRGGGAVVAALRPRQWLKNILVLAAPGAAGVLSEASIAASVACAFGALCLVSSAGYLVNDVLDREVDRRHPTKRYRPIAAGALHHRVALVLALGLVTAGLALALIVSWETAALVGAYGAVTFSYSTMLKHIELLDILAVSLGFLLRMVTGAVAAEVAMSDWFLVVAAFGSLFMVVGKRHAERNELGERAGELRSTLAAYTPAFTEQLLTVCLGVILLAYFLWAFETDTMEPLAVRVSILPFVYVVLRYRLQLDRGMGAAPEDLVLGDRGLQWGGLAWAMVFTAAVYL
ncbi:MAG: decaprenyl-phosphate phosphoribosyltransferase [Actinomycetia bacterium]|nr:decaprenyl-phosphate phosphoribosyltransferase [Actinomycetes bacterium]